MSSLTDVGYVTPAGQDIFPTTGPHLDVRVQKEGKYIDPATIRSLLTRLKIGKERKSLYAQTGEQFSPNYAITSPFGSRAAPTKGASTQHMGIDYGIPGGTPIAFEGPGSFTPGEGKGVIQTTDAQGTPYQIELLHTKGGKKTDINQTTQLPQQTQQTNPQNTYIIIDRRNKDKSSEDFLAEYLGENLKQKQRPLTSMIDPVAMLTQAFSQTPNYLS